MISRATKLLITAACFALMVSAAPAGTDPTPHPSPNGRFVIVSTRDTAKNDFSFELRRSDGEVRYEYKGGYLLSYASHVLWSPKNDFVALRVQTGKYIKDTLVIDCATGKALMVSNDPDAQTTPIRWTKRGELVVETEGSFGGKADADMVWAHYRYRRTLRLRDSGSRFECVFNGAIVYPGRAQLLEDGYRPNSAR